MSQPWWYSGDESAEPAEAPQAGAGVDWMSLLAGAQKVVDWATDRVLAPHSEHEDPHEHPECMVCRAMVVADRFDVGIPKSWPPSGWSGGGATSSRPDLGEPGQSEGADLADDAIQWIPIVDDAGN